MIHFYDLNDGPFKVIKNHQKDIEMRLYDEKRKLLKKDDYICFTNNVTEESLFVKIKELHVFNDFEELYKHFPKTRLGYLENEEANYTDMEEYYPQEKQKMHQVVGIEIENIDLFDNNIRFAKKDDVNDLLELLRYVLMVHHQLNPSIFKTNNSKYDVDALYELIEKRQIIVYDDGILKGHLFYYLNEFEESGYMHKRKELYVDDLVVKEDYQRQRIAQNLYNNIRKIAKLLGANYITLNVWNGNKALDFYQKMGLKVRYYEMEEEL